jgi:hypothetical protein
MREYGLSMLNILGLLCLSFTARVFLLLIFHSQSTAKEFKKAENKIRKSLKSPNNTLSNAGNR